VSYSRRAVKIHTILTDNGIQFTNRRRDILAFMTPFDRICRKHGIEHRLTKVKHPWTDGRVERMNRTIKEATMDGESVRHCSSNPD
jgi:transposase InsO family protein